MSLGPDYEAKLAELRAAFRAQLPQIKAQLDEAAAGLTAAAIDERARMSQLAHRLAGNGALFGFPEITEWGRRTERLCRGNAPVEQLVAATRDFDAVVAQICGLAGE
jgi:HPt (histidine-containing phosphotransfer) domain-containing protein